jgi:cell division transport system permease protein
MKHWLPYNPSALRRLFSPLSTSVFNILIIGITLSLPTGLYALLTNVQGLFTQLSNTPQISLYLQLGVQDADIANVRQRLAHHPHIQHSEFVPRAQALQQLKKSSGLEDVIDSLPKNPLPDAFIVQPYQNNAKTLEKLRSELASLSKVETAQLDSAWASKLEALLKLGRVSVILLAGLFGLALVAITFNTIRLQVLTRHEEIAVARLIGATDSFIRRPFLYLGAAQGLIGGLIAWLIVTLGLTLVEHQLDKLSQLYTRPLQLQSLSSADGLTLLIVSTYLGWLGAWLSVTRLLSKIRAL